MLLHPIIGTRLASLLLAVLLPLGGSLSLAAPTPPTATSGPNAPTPPDLLKQTQAELAAARERGDRAREIDLLVQLSLLHRGLGQLQPAQAALQQALALARQSEDWQRLAQVLQNQVLFALPADQRQSFLAAQLAQAEQTGDRGSEIVVLGLLALWQHHTGQGQPAKRLARLEQYRQQARQAGDLALELAAINSLGNFYTATEQMTAVMALLPRRIEILRQRGQTSQLLTLLAQQGTAAKQQGDTPAAIAHFQELLTLARQRQALIMEAQALRELAQLQGDQGLTFLQAQVAQMQTAQQPASEAIARQLLAQLALSQGQTDSAIAQAEAAVALWARLDNQPLHRQALSLLVQIYTQSGQPQRAEAIRQRQVQLVTQGQPPDAQLRQLQTQALTYLSEGSLTAALKTLEQALTLARSRQLPAQQAAILKQMAQVHERRGDDRGIRFLQAQLAQVQQQGDRASAAIVLGALGFAYGSLGDVVQAIERYEAQVELLQTLRAAAPEPLRSFYQKTQNQSLGILSYAYGLLGDTAQQDALMQQQADLLRDIGDPRLEMQTLPSLIGLMYQQGNYAMGIRYTQRLIKLVQDFLQRPQFQTFGLLNQQQLQYQQLLALLYAANNEPQKAIATLEKGLALVDQQARKTPGLTDDQASLKSAFLQGLARIYIELGDYDTAQRYHQRLDDLAATTGNAMFQNAQYQTARDRALILLRQNQPQAAENALKPLVAFLAQLRETFARMAPYTKMLRSEAQQDMQRLRFYETIVDVYLLWQAALVAQNQPAAALKVAEEGRARAFAELLTSRLAADPATAPATTPLTLPQIRQIAQTQNATLVQYSIIYDDLKYAGFQVGGDRPQPAKLFIWVVKPDGELAFEQVDLTQALPTGTTLAELVPDMRLALGVRGRGLGVTPKTAVPTSSDQAAALQQLHRLLIAPIAPHLPTEPTQRVVFIPQDSLFLVPFAALQDPDGRALIERHTILTAPSIQVLALTRQQKAKRVAKTPLRPGQPLIVGNPTMPRLLVKPGLPAQPLPPLPGAEREVRDIAQLFGVEPLIGAAATEPAIAQRIEQASLIHLATHGILDDLFGFQSSLALAPVPPDPTTTEIPPNQDGFLTAREILQLDLTADLVVLSACDTGRGRVSGDGVVGLARSFIGAGVPSVVVSLWAVPDAPTATLMTRFYENLKRTPDKAQALRQAMLATRAQYPHPRNWAAFTLIGAAE